MKTGSLAGSITGLILLALLNVYAMQAQTKKIFHKSHSGKKSAFKKSLACAFFGTQHSNFGRLLLDSEKSIETILISPFNYNPETSRLFAIKLVNDTMVKFIFTNDLDLINLKQKQFKHGSMYKINQVYFQKGFYTNKALLGRTNRIQLLKIMFDIIDDATKPEFNVKFFGFDEQLNKTE